MHAILQWIYDNPGKITAAVVLVLKWIYNARPAPGQPFVFSNFFWLFIGEVVQEEPSAQTKLAIAPTASVGKPNA